MAFFNLFQSLILLVTLIAIPPFSASAYRPSMTNNVNPTAFEFRSNPKTLTARLNLDNNDPQSSNCWDSLIQLQSCSGEAIMFFLNGETVLSDGCCEAIRVIEHQCWPALLGSLGFTTQETDILKGYCDEAEETHHRHDSPPSIPSPPKGYHPNNREAVRFP